MKYIFTVICISLFFAFGCKDIESKPKSSIKIEDLMGKWESLDSTLKKNEMGVFEYVKDTLNFTIDTFSDVNHKKDTHVMHRRGSQFSNFVFSTKDVDVLMLDYFGGIKIIYKSEHIMTLSGGVLTLGNIYDLYPLGHMDSHMDKYKKISNL